MAKQSTVKNRKKKAAPPGMGLALALMAALALALCGAALLLPAQSAYVLPVVINRVMTANPSLCYGVDGAYYDWIELKNTSEAAVSLTGWKLTDSGDLRDACVFGDVTMGPGEVLIVYCDAAPGDGAGGEIFTGFKLSGDGELLLIADAAQHMTALEVPALGKGEVYARDEVSGEYHIEDFEAMDGDGAAAGGGHSAPHYDPHGVMLSELMPMNRSVLADGDGDFSDWIELYNGSSAAVNLEGYALTDRERLRKWVFPEVTLSPGQYMIVFASGKNRRTPGQELHTSFKLSGKGETVRLSDPEGQVISQIDYDSAVADQSLTRAEGGAMTDTLAPSPGTGESGAIRLMDNALGLYVNEVCSGGFDGDWVEIYNGGGAAADLSGMGLSDDPSRPRRWQFPAGTSLQPGGYLIVGCGEDRDEDSPLRPACTADFRIGAGETVCLSTREGRVIDRIQVPAGFDGSVGRAPGMDVQRCFAQATPGAANTTASYARVRQNIAFSPTPGLVRGDSVTVTLSAEPGQVIHYTTDGTLPTASSPVYTGPITLTGTTCLWALADPVDAVVNKPTAGTYVFASHNLRVICVNGAPGRLNGETGMLNTGEKDAEAEVYMEIYDTDGTQMISQPCYMSITGHNTRTKAAQKGFKIKARRADGDTRFCSKLFTNRDYDAFKVLTIRASGQDYNKTHMLDSVLTSTMRDTNVMYQETEVCVLYVNGEYWGIYNLREHIDKHSVAQYMGWRNVDKVNIVRRSGEKATATAGKSDEYKQLIEWVGKTDFSDEANMDILRQQIVVESYLDFVITQMYTCNQDLSNVRCYRSLTEGNRWRWAIFDLDLSFRLNGDNYVDDWLEASAGTITGIDTTLFRGLMENPGVRDQFLTRFGELLCDNYAAENVVQKIKARRALIKDEMVNECRRWSWSYSTWEEEVDRITEYARVRPRIVVGYLCDTFHLSEAERERYFGRALAINP